MTLINKHDLDIVKTYLHTKINFLGQGFEKLEHDRQTVTETDVTDNITTLHSHMLIISLMDVMTVNKQITGITMEYHHLDKMLQLCKSRDHNRRQYYII